MSVLVLGGAGYIGSHTVYELIDAGRDVVIVRFRIAQAILVIQSSAGPPAGFAALPGESGQTIHHLRNPQVYTRLPLRYNQSVFRSEQIKGGAISGRR